MTEWDLQHKLLLSNTLELSTSRNWSIISSSIQQALVLSFKDGEEKMFNPKV